MLNRNFIYAALATPLFAVTPLLPISLISFFQLFRLVYLRPNINRYLAIGIAFNSFYFFCVYIFTNDISRSIFTILVFFLFLNVRSFKKIAIMQYVIFSLIVISLYQFVLPSGTPILIISPILFCLILLFSAKPLDKVLINFITFVSLVTFNRRYMTLVVLCYSFFTRIIHKYPFLIGALVSITFPIFSLLINSLFDDTGSLYSRARQIFYMLSVIDSDPSILLFGAEFSDLEFPPFFWPGDTKLFGTIFEFGVIFFAINALLLYKSNVSACSPEVKFLMGLTAFNYLAGSVLALSILTLMSRK